MSNGTRIRYEHIEDDSQVPRSPDVTENPSAHYIALARLQPTLEWQKMSMADLLVYLDTALSFAGQMTALERRFNEVIGEVRNAEGKNTQQDTAISNVEGLIATLQSRLSSLEGRLQVLETSGAGTGTTGHTAHPDTFRYGVRAQDGTVRGTEQEMPYTDVPVSLPIHFPGATAITDEWFFRVPADTRVTSIRNVGFTPIEELGTALWHYDRATRVYNFTNELVAGFEGSYSIGLERVPISGSLQYSLQETGGTVRGDVHDKDYADLPASVDITFPQAVAANDKWVFTVPARASVTSIQRKSDGNVVTGDWTHTPASVGPPATADTWSFTGLTPGTSGEFTISLIERTGG